MKFAAEHSTGAKSMDRKIKKLVAYVNNQIEHINAGNPAEESSIRWAQQTIEQGIKNIASGFFANRIA